MLFSALPCTETDRRSVSALFFSILYLATTICLRVSPTHISLDGISQC
ncbi:hypothetical protein HT576_20900 [Haloterrigena sp. SYSU A121-1]|uniref:Uncharacterized protein n=1 Tax=Haloterrigena gelatinilytica TaxID=2741724 RepID=A0A8J8KDF4_9EURY|nr:hypothetical protein [Haloterrigena gelatinilytica]